VELGFDIISVNKMTSKKPTREGGNQVINLPLFLVTLPRTENSKNIFKLICNIIIKVEAYRTQNGLTLSQFSTVRPCLGKLQATPSLLVVWVGPSTQGLPRKKRMKTLHRAAATAS
jgi:hypothetical protein